MKTVHRGGRGGHKAIDKPRRNYRDVYLRKVPYRGNQPAHLHHPLLLQVSCREKTQNFTKTARRAWPREHSRLSAHARVALFCTPKNNSITNSSYVSRAVGASLCARTPSLPRPRRKSDVSAPLLVVRSPPMLSQACGLIPDR